MRLLTRLVLAGAAAVTAWLLTGVVTIRAIDDPIRIGLLPSDQVPLVAFGVLLALSGAVRRPERVAGLVALAALATLPWWPVDWPPALLLLTGPIGWAWYAACLACSIELPTGGWWWWRARRVVADPVRTPRLVAATTAVLLTGAALVMAPQQPAGDELDYLVITQSLRLDGDLRIENNHQRVDYEAYHDGVLLPSYLQRGRDGQIYPVHAAGLPLLLLPGFAVAGYAGAVATVILICALGAGLLWHLAFCLTESASAAWVGTAAAVGAAPWFLHARVVFPDAPAAALVLVALWAVIEPARFTGWRLVWPAVALAWLPWMHTRFAVLAAVLGATVMWRWLQSPLRAPRALVWFVAPALVGAAAWFGFFWVIYGTPDPSAPYGAYTQTAWRHLPTGLAGLLVDQQFGLLGTAPVLLLAGYGAVRGWWPVVIAQRPGDATARAPRALVATVVIVLAVLYTAVTASYRMWWGGLSAPARFLAPLVLPLGLLVALGWQALRTRSSRGVAVALLAVSLALTAAMVVVDRGQLAYNSRDGVARWADWGSRIVDLAAAMPAAHRDPPVLVVRDAAVWLLAGLAAWGLLRLVERQQALTRAGILWSVVAVGVLAPSAVWALRGVVPWHPARSQVDWLLADAVSADARPLLLTAPRDAGPRRWFDFDVMSAPARAQDAFTALTVDRLPAGRYRVFASGLAPGTRLGVAVGQERATAFVADAEVRQGRAVMEVLLPMPVDRLIVRSSARSESGQGRVWLRGDDIYGASRGRDEAWAIAPATRAARLGELRLFFQAEGVFPEADGLWLAGDAAGVLGVSGPPGTPVRLQVTAGARAVVLRTDVGPRHREMRLDAGQSTTVDAGRLPSRGTQQVRFSVEGGFRPSLVAASDDARKLGVWVVLDQNRTTPLR